MATTLSLAAVERAFETAGLLLRADARLPSVAALVAGGPIRGSWWSHPLAHPIYDACQALEHRPDALLVKLVAGKVTYVHRRLWPALLAIGAAGEPWQTRGLSPAARSLLARVAAEGSARTDALRRAAPARAKAVAGAARELEARLLVSAEDVHTESGAHAKRLESWAAWAERTGTAPSAGGANAARAAIEGAVRRYAGADYRDALLPWGATSPPARARRTRRSSSSSSP